MIGPRSGVTGVVGHQPERGGGSVVMIGVMSVLLMLSVGAICIAGYLVAAHRVRSAADLAALSGAMAFTAGQDSCTAARRNVSLNGAQLVSCDQVGDAIDFVVTVRAEVTVAVRVPGLPRRLRAEAHAGAASP